MQLSWSSNDTVNHKIIFFLTTWSLKFHVLRFENRLFFHSEAFEKITFRWLLKGEFISRDSRDNWWENISQHLTKIETLPFTKIMVWNFVEKNGFSSNRRREKHCVYIGNKITDSNSSESSKNFILVGNLLLCSLGPQIWLLFLLFFINTSK